MMYGHELAVWTGEFLSDLWGTEVLEPESMTSWMTNVRWPTDDAAVASAVSARLLSEYDTRLNVFTLNGLVYSRISLQIYLTMEDVERVGALVMQLLDEAAHCLRSSGNNTSTRSILESSDGGKGCEWVIALPRSIVESTRPVVMALAQ